MFLFVLVAFTKDKKTESNFIKVAKEEAKGLCQCQQENTVCYIKYFITYFITLRG